MTQHTFDLDSFNAIYRQLRWACLNSMPVDVGEVHAQKVDKPEWVSREVTNLMFEYPIPSQASQLQDEVGPNLPWAEDHFLERVSGRSLNPPPSAEYWPYAQQGHREHTNRLGEFSHTYPERFWPRYAGRQVKARKGIRFIYGDLDDLVEILVRTPYSRQAYLPIWFPEDLRAAQEGERVPCTLGYHFLLRGGKLHMTYFIRSCDLVRFFRDDVYMACRLVQWVLALILTYKSDGSWKDVKPGILTMHIVSLHIFEGDVPHLQGEIDAEAQ